MKYQGPAHPYLEDGTWFLKKPGRAGEPNDKVYWTSDGKEVRRGEDGPVMRRKDVYPYGTFDPDFVTPYVHLTVNHIAYFLKAHGTLYWFSCQSLELLNNMHSQLFLKRNTRRDTWMLELLQANYRVKELTLRGYKKKNYEFRCALCAKYYIYPGSFEKHEEECRAAAEIDLDRVIGLSKERVWVDEDFFKVIIN